MKRFLTTALLLILAACNSLTNGQSKSLNVNDFQKQLMATPNAQLIDVRTPEEYAERHLENASNINFNADDFIDKIEKLDKSRPVFVYCLSGGRSQKAAALISKKGFHEVYEMNGGILAWSDAKKPLIESNQTKSTGLTMDSYLKNVTKDKLVLVDFKAVWCGPCKMLKPIVEKTEKANAAKLELLTIDVDENPELANEMHIRSIPLLILYKQGKEVWRSLGVVDQPTIQEQIDKN
ncbi:MAG: thioredoxin domain-containing protein [Chitinophagales bacterium]